MLNDFSSVKPVGLKCEYKLNPTGIDIKEPLLSWFTEYAGENSYQSSYRIILSNSNVDIFDSGKINSSESSVLLKDIELKSNASYYWKVMIWNEKDEASEWSDEAFFSTGLFEQSEWKAKWIRHNYTTIEDEYIHFKEGVDKWIWHPLKNNEDKFRTVILKRDFEAGQVESARIIITADEKFKLWINDVFVSESDDKIFSWSRPKHLDVKKYLKVERNQIKIRGTNSYVDNPCVLLRLEIITFEGSTFISSGDAGWQSSFEDANNFITAKVIKIVGEKPYRVPEPGLTFNPAAYFKKKINVNKKIKRAFAYCSALGLLHLEINDKKISEGNLLPGWCDYNQRAYYNAYDITSIINSENSINVILADGYYSGYCGWEKGRGYYGKYPALKFQLMITFEDGTEEIIYSDETWESSEGPIKEADILMGEYNDANVLVDNYKKVIVVDDVNLLMTNYKGNVVRQKIELKPIKIQRLPHSLVRNDRDALDNVFIVDFGQNFAGYVRLKLNNTKAKVELRFAEVLHKDGSLYLDNIRMARATDTYISTGEGEEIWEPLFTYHGFRYVEVSGLDDVTEDTITGISINSLEEQTGFIRTSNEKQNKLFECILWNQKSNYIDIPTDCPQRDERFGWTGDAVSYFRTAAFNFDVSAFYKNWFGNFFEAQKENGELPPFAPAVNMGVGPIFYNAGGWADTAVIALYQYYQYYNDVYILEEYYDKIKLYLDSLIKQSDDFILPEYGYGDWLSSGKETSKSFINTAYFILDISLMIKICDLLQHTDDEIYYNDILRDAKYSFKQKFLNANYELKEYTQTAAVLSIHFNLLGIEGTEKAKEFLVNDIIKNGYHLTAGFLGLSFIMPVLSSMNKNDIAWKVLTNEDYPSWFNMINLGATTLWERWDAYHPEKEFFDPTMNSFNHCSLGCVGEWLFSSLAGIKNLSSGFKNIRIEPYIPENLDFIEASYKSIYGIIKSNCKKERNKIILDISIPFNVNAEVVLSNKIKKLGSGNYKFEYNYKQETL